MSRPRAAGTCSIYVKFNHGKPTHTPLHSHPSYHSRQTLDYKNLCVQIHNPSRPSSELLPKHSCKSLHKLVFGAAENGNTRGETLTMRGDSRKPGTERHSVSLTNFNTPPHININISCHPEISKPAALTKTLFPARARARAGKKRKTKQNYDNKPS